MCHLVAATAAAAAATVVCRLVDNDASWQAHPVGVVQAVDGALPATGLFLVLLDGDDPHHQLLLQFLHFLLFGLLGLHLVDNFRQAYFQPIACFSRKGALYATLSAFHMFPVFGKNLTRLVVIHSVSQ